MATMITLPNNCRVKCKERRCLDLLFASFAICLKGANKQNRNYERCFSAFPFRIV
jgi:hypothetical protein